MRHPLFAHRRTLVAASLAGLALLVFAPKANGRIADPGSAAVREQSTNPKAWEPSRASDREESPTQSPVGAVRVQNPDRSSPPTRATANLEYALSLAGLAPPPWGGSREVTSAAEPQVARRDSPTASDWTDDWGLGTGLLAALALTGGLALVLRHHRTFSTLR